jgi:hypothetical protein
MRGPSGYSRWVLLDVLGLLAFAVFIVCVIGAAAGVTWLVVKFSPAKKPKPAADAKP